MTERAPAVAVRRIVPNVFDAEPRPTVAFYADVLGLTVAMDAGWIVTLAAPGGHGAAQLSVFEQDAEGDRRPFVSIEVSDVDAVRARAVDLGAAVVYPIRDEPWGVRRFMLRDPAGRVVNVLSHVPRPGA